MNAFRIICTPTFVRNWMTKLFKVPSDPFIFKDIYFKNRIGLGAGFDKNALYLKELETLGFGFVEIGTVTPRPQKGNPKPRLFRLPDDEALINRMGFNNDGVNEVGERLKKWRIRELNHEMKSPSFKRLIIGGNIGKNKDTPNEEAWKDYAICFNALHHYVDFFVVNVSSPNTIGLRALQAKEALKTILTNLQNLNDKIKKPKPVFLKIAPDLEKEQLDNVLELAKEISLEGIVASNTTIHRVGLQTKIEKVEHMGMGGLSGKPLIKKTAELIKYIHQKTNGSLVIIGSGGIFESMDMKNIFDCGASLGEVWTGLIYKGPFIVRDLYKGYN